MICRRAAAGQNEEESHHRLRWTKSERPGASCTCGILCHIAQQFKFLVPCANFFRNEGLVTFEPRAQEKRADQKPEESRTVTWKERVGSTRSRFWTHRGSEDLCFFRRSCGEAGLIASSSQLLFAS